jgi:replication factor A2
VTVKQVLNAAQVHPDSDFTIDGVEVGSVSSPRPTINAFNSFTQVLIVGSVRNRSVTATNVQYEVGDGTGYVDVRQWLDSADDEAGKMDGIE